MVRVRTRKDKDKVNKSATKAPQVWKRAGRSSIVTRSFRNLSISVQDDMDIESRGHHSLQSEHSSDHLRSQEAVPIVQQGVQQVHQVVQGEGHQGSQVEQEDGNIDYNTPEATRIGEQCDLAEWLDPDVPGPVDGPIVEDTDGWCMVDKLGAWECGLCEFHTLEEVPPLYREKWTRAIAIILRRVISAQTDADVNRGLKWFLLSSQVFL